MLQPESNKLTQVSRPHKDHSLSTLNSLHRQPTVVPPATPDQENLPNQLNVQKKKTRPTIGDRFVPSIKHKFNMMPEPKVVASDISSSQTTLDLLYKQQILDQQINIESESGSLKFSNQNTFSYNEHVYYLDQIDPRNQNSPLVDHKYFALPETVCQHYSKYIRKIPKVPYKVLDAPALQDDFYLNLIDWSHQNTLSVALGQCVYLWSGQNCKVTKLLDLSTDQVTSVAWSLHGPHLGVGTNNGEVQIWDTNKLQKVQTMKGHLARVGTLCFSDNLLSSGSRDKQIIQRDYRSKPNNFWKYSAHKQEVCGLKWSPDSQLLASGGNDNKLFIWSANQSSQPVCRFNDHQAAVKAIAWSPHQHGLLASGGGTADKTIRFWNALDGKHLFKEDTGSQVCNLMFSKVENELISTHGYSQNQIILWKVNGMKRIATLVGHSTRVLYLAMSPNGQTIVTGAGDETLRFWNIYPQNNVDEKQSNCQLLAQNISIR